MTIKIIVITVVTLVYLYELYLNRLRISSAKNPVPACVADVYSAETHAKQQAYNTEKCRLNYLRLSVSLWSIGGSRRCRKAASPFRETPEG